MHGVSKADWQLRIERCCRGGEGKAVKFEGERSEQTLIMVICSSSQETERINNKTLPAQAFSIATHTHAQGLSRSS